MNSGGVGGKVEIYNWDGDLLWTYTLSDNDYQHHHDVEPLPNGNVLMIAWERKTAEEAYAAGRTSLNDNPLNEMWSSAIFEIQSDGNGGGEVVWGLLSTVGAMLLVAVTLRLVSAVDHSTKPLGSKENKVSQFFYNKWYIDELYDEWIVKPLWSMSNFCWKKFDQGFIDKSVNLSGRGARGIGWFGSLFHTGQVNTYAFFLTLGLLLVLLMVVS